MEDLGFKTGDRVLILGATGFIGKRLVRALAENKIRLRILARTPSRAKGIITEDSDAEIVKGNLLDEKSLEDAMKGIHSCYYLVHSMGGKSITKNTEFAEKDKAAARNFIHAADSQGVKRVIYLGGLGEKGSDLSEHLRSRAKVAEIISSGKVRSTILRAAVIIGAGGASYEMLRYLVERLPVMTCPKWINTRIQPIAVKNVIEYLAGCLMNPATAGKTFDIGGPEILTYKTMMHKYAEARGLAKRLIIDIPLLTPTLSAYWVDLVTPVPSGIAHPLIEGMKNEVICLDQSIDQYVSIQKIPFKDAVKTAVSEETTGPGLTGF
jgi:uncharacterized protein YbjT (DUF2867 family)